jgi:hypothetical protein
MSIRSRGPAMLRSAGLGLGMAATLVACGTTTPSGNGNSTVAGFLASATASDGASSQVQSGSPPAASGGPSIAVSAPGNVVAGGTAVVRIQSSQPFSTVFAFVDGVTGFLQVSLKAPTMDTTLAVNVAGGIPAGNFTQDYRVANASGAVGTSSTVPSVASSNTAPSSNITGTWGIQGSPVFALTQNGANVTGSLVIPGLGMIQGVTITSTVSGTVSGNLFTATSRLQVAATGGGSNLQCSETDGLSLQISGNSMTGTYTTGTITCNFQGFTSPANLPFTITLTKQ